jgi:hypothetical protein
MCVCPHERHHVRLSTWTITFPAGWIDVKFDMGDFYENRTALSGVLHADICIVADDTIPPQKNFCATVNIFIMLAVT